MARCSVVALSIVTLCALTVAGIGPAYGDPALPGGETTATVDGSNAFSQPAANLSFEQRLDFSVGNSFFRNPWVTAPASTAARDGLGPLFNSTSCQGCHIKDGRGHPPRPGQAQAVSLLIRLSLPEGATRIREPHMGVIPEPNYGDQLQDFGILGVDPEARINWSYEEKILTFENGESFSLRQPVFEFSDLAYGDMHPDTLFSPRVAPSMIGLGLLDAIPAADILALEDVNDADGDGISGKANRVWNQRTNDFDLGRFGWKAGQPTVEQQAAGAFFGDIGISSSFNNAKPCSFRQTSCLSAPTGGEPELSDQILDVVTFYSRHLAVPYRPDAADEEILAGQEIFASVGCAACHRPSWVTGTVEDNALSQQRIYPYTDLLLHDMGEDLADNRPEFDANGREWRTPPLWGLGRYQEVNGHTELLHDGRARNIFEAILWHGGEAEASRDAVVALDETERALLLKFLGSL